MEPFLSEIVLFSFNFAPKGFALCNGQLLSINQNQALFSLLGYTYGGNGLTTFGLPDLRGRALGHVGNGYILGNSVGASSHTLSIQEMAPHIHEATKSVNATYAPPVGGAVGSGNPVAAAFAENPNFPNRFSHKFDEGFGEQQLATNHNSDSSGGSQPHNNMMPYLVLNYCIALQGVFPSPN